MVGKYQTTELRTISLFGATGTIGDNTLEIIRNNKNRFKLKVVTAGWNIDKLVKICNEFRPEVVVILDQSKLEYLKTTLSKLGITIMFGEEGLLEAASVKVDVAVIGISGMAGLKPTMKLIESADVIAIANKESIVCGGEFLTDKISKYNRILVPVDSEHSALFQTIEPNAMDEMSSIVLTASGGPFLNRNLADLENVSLAEALKHPTWQMGKKNSIDSATMVNKALEMIEAYYLFPVTIDQIKVVIHPESIIHCFVNFIDGTSKALLSNNDMTKSISYAMNYPARLPMPKEFNIVDYGSLNFRELDVNRFSVIELVYQVLHLGGSAPIIFNAVNEEMVDCYIKGKIKFLDIVTNITKVIEGAKIEKVESLDHVYEIEQSARSLARTFL